MFAVIRAGGQQYRVENESLLQVDLMDGEIGSEVEFSDVLIVGDGDRTVIGTPYVKDARVKAEIVEHRKGPKVLVFHKLPRKSSRKLRGHRQHYTVVKVTQVIGG
ncbi:MAG: 50S ribosomal protein L21 [Thermodesulfovibrionales bacterium]